MTADVYAIEAVDPFRFQVGAFAERTRGIVTAEHISTVLSDVENAVVANDGLAAGHQVSGCLRGSSTGRAVNVLVIGDGAWGAAFLLRRDDLAQQGSD